MKGVSKDGDGSGSTSSITDFKRLGDSSTNDSCFDASQYTFFGGKDVVKEVELGGLEDDGVLDKTGLEWLDDLEYPFSFTNNEEKEEGGILESLSDIDDLTSTFNKGGILESLSDIDDLTSTFNKLNRVVAQPRSLGVIGDRGSSSRGSSSTIDWSQEADTSENANDNKRWWSQPYTHTTNLPESKSLHRTSSYPQPLQQQHRSINPNHSLNSSLNHPPPIGTRPQLLSRHSSLTFSPNQLHLTGLSPYSTNIAPYFPTSPVSNRNLAYFPTSPNVLQQQLSLPIAWDNCSFSPISLYQQLSLPNELFPSHLLSQQRSYIQSRLSNSHPSPQRNISSRKARQNTRFSQQNSDTSSQNSDTTISQFRSKYMSAEEIASISKMQHASTRKHDPYADDYYHQACLAKRLNHPFHPSSIKDSTHRPYHLLEADTTSADTPKPLELEPTVAARAIIEDGFCTLLDIDDINRLLQSIKPQDGGSHLRRRRQILLEGLAASVQLVDPFNHSAGPHPKDDVIFLRLTSLSKGIELIARFIQLLYPGTELARIVCMAVFRHLRVLFGGLPSKPTTDLSTAVATCVGNMDLGALSACLAAVVCSSEQPPLRPFGSSSGDGASIVIKSVLDRANDLISASNSYNPPNITLWRASFDAFFMLLTKYCISKYENIVQSVVDTGEAVGREMPVELLRSSIPHTNGLQRQQLLDFAERSLPVSGYSGYGDVKGLMTSESVPG